LEDISAGAPEHVARVDDMALIDVPADDRGPRCINCYSVDVERFDAIDGYKFELDPSRLVYSLQWKHKGHPPDLHLAFVQELPEQWIGAASLALLGALRRWAPHAINWARCRTSCRFSTPLKRLWLARLRGGINCPLDGAMTGPRGRSPDVRAPCGPVSTC
jgi:hypothetical protein